jgi:hypothetical protein
MNTPTYVPSTRRQQWGSFFWGFCALVFGWTLFIYWWRVVLTEDQPDALLRLLAAIGIFIVLLLIGTAVWIWHNRRLARRGNRGLATRYRVRSYERDALGREVSLPLQDGVHQASVLTVNATDARKTYREVRPSRPLQKRRQAS